MAEILFDKNLEFEINLIGYRSQGECIVFFLKTDGETVYAGIVDCYKDKHGNEAIRLLEEEKRKSFDFVCWTHPHFDHSLGIDKIIEEYCDSNTEFWMPFPVNDAFKHCCKIAGIAHEKISNILTERKNKREFKIRVAADSKNLKTIYCSGNFSNEKIDFSIKSFAPSSEDILAYTEKDSQSIDKINKYSVGLVIEIGHFSFILGGDVENEIINEIDKSYIPNQPNYIKIPHHSSKTSDALIGMLKIFNYSAPQVATSTVFYTKGLPDIEVLDKYKKWEDKTEIYVTGSTKDKEENKKRLGIIKTTVDILEKREIPMKTKIDGNAIEYYNPHKKINKGTG